MTNRLEGRAAFVTGAGTGIGRAIARRLAADGALVFCAGRSMDRLEETVRLVSTDGGRAAALHCDVTDRDSVRGAVGQAAARSPKIHILVNNAGAGGPNPITAEDDSRWHEIVATNLTGLYNVTKAVVPRMPDHDGGRVISIASVLARFGVPGYTAYCASKSGVLGFTRALALELAHREITVNAVCPGWVETEMAVHGMEAQATANGIDYETFRRKALHVVPLQRMLQPEEIAGLVAWLASDEASGMTGQSIGLNAGSHME